MDDRSRRRFADTHPQRPVGAPRQRDRAGLAAALERSRCAPARGLYPRLVRGRAAPGREGTSRRAEVRQRQAGHQGDQARLHARAAASTPRSASCRATSTVSASRSCPRRAASCPTPRRAPPMSAAKSSARCSEPCRASAKTRFPSPPVSPSSSRASTSRPRASGANCSSMVHDDVDGRQGRRGAGLQAAHREPPRPHAVGHGAQPREQRRSRRVGRLHHQPRDQRRRLSRPGRCQDAEAAARLQPRRRGARFRPASRSRRSKPTEIEITGADRQKVGQLAAEIRSLRPPEPYKGKGIKYATRRSGAKKARRSRGETRHVRSQRSIRPPPAAHALRAAPGRRRPSSPQRVPLGQAHLRPGHRRPEGR